MAKILFGAMVTDMRGKQGGAVYSRNRYGSYIRNKTSPVQPNTPAQQAVKANLSFLSQLYRTLSDTDRLLWALASQDFPRVDKFGNKQYLTGAALFNSLNSGVLEATGASIDAPPPPQLLSNFTFTGWTFDKTLGTATLHLDVLDNTADDVLVVYITPPISAGINYIKNRLIKLGTYSNADWSTGDVVITTEMLALFGYPTAGGINPPAGTRFGFSCYTVNGISGQKGVAQSGIVIVP